MGADEGKPKELKTWERRPWPKIGDARIEATYYSVGLVLSQWERYETALSILFSALASSRHSQAATRAYNAVRTFEGRAEMLRAASDAHFEEKPDATLQKELKNLLINSKGFSSRRNDIAHGVVDGFLPLEPSTDTHLYTTYALFPSRSSFKGRALDGKPTYCMTSNELIYFFERIFELQAPAVDLAIALIDRARRPSFQKLYERAPQSANPEVGQKGQQDILRSPQPSPP